MDNASKYDILLRTVNESEMSVEERDRAIVELFPDFGVGEAYNNKYLTDYVIENYSYNRSLGMTAKQAAHAAEVSSILIEEGLIGKGVSLERFMTLVKAELFATAIMRRKHLAIIDKEATSGNLFAALKFLEKVHPDLYAEQPKTIVKTEVTIRKSPEQELKDRGIPLPDIPVQDLDD